MIKQVKTYLLLYVLSIGLCLDVVAQQKTVLDNYTMLLYNRDNTIPFQNLQNRKIVVVGVNKRAYHSFLEMAEKYAEISFIDFSDYTEQVKPFNTIIVVGRNQELNQQRLLDIQQSASSGKDVVVCTFQGNSSKFHLQSPQFGGRLTELVGTAGVDDEQENMAMSLFGGLSISSGLSRNKTSKTRIEYGYDKRFQKIHPILTKKIDEIAEEAILSKATPGMVVMAVKSGRVIFEKAYGKHTYDGIQQDRVGDIFDLASVSKIVGTVPVVMHLYEQHLLSLDSTIGVYLSEARGTNKESIDLRTVLLHEAGFVPYIPFYRQLKKEDLQKTYSETHRVKVADGVYLRTGYYENVMWPEMLASVVKPKGNYVYSDISLYVMKEIVERVSGKPLDQYVSDFLYKPIGMYTAGYNPRNRFEKNRIVPTENDTEFRKILLEGYVHDQGAAMAGGVAGHAGLFATANDLAIFGQMMLNRGIYGGRRYFQPETVDLFTSNQSQHSRRGLGFDRFDPKSKNGYPSKLTNSSVFGHTGYTGTCIWMDPQNQLVYVFLSNRVHPTVNSKLIDLNIRGRIQDAIYETIKTRS